MAVVENSIMISAPPEDVFDFLANLANEPRWNPDCQLVEQLSEPPVGQGSKWRAKWKGGPAVEVEVFAYDRPRSLTTGNEGTLEVRSTWTCSSVNGGTELASRFEAVAHGAMKLLFPVLMRKFRRDSPVRLARIKAMVEAQPGTQ